MQQWTYPFHPLLARAVEYADCIFTEGYDIKQSDGETLGTEL